jgi:hypothetical protein
MVHKQTRANYQVARTRIGPANYHLCPCRQPSLCTASETGRFSSEKRRKTLEVIGYLSAMSQQLPAT